MPRSPWDSAVTLSVIWAIALVGPSCGTAPGARSPDGFTAQDGRSPQPESGLQADAPTTLTDAASGADAAVAASAGCGLAGAFTGYNPTVHITSSGTDRTYALSVPSSYDPSHPYALVFAFHGDGGTGDGLRTAFGLEGPGAGQAIFVYPDATLASGQSWDLDDPLATNADMTFFTDLVTSLESSYCVDTHRVFAAGFSRGAYFVNFINCYLGTAVVRAIAANSGSGPYGPAADFDACGHFICSGRAAAALLIQGDADTTVLPSDAMYSYGQWTWANHCASTTTPVAPSPCVVNDGCDPDHPVEWCEVPCLGHAIWSNAPAAIWGFFAART
jgi:polyhydroxybutyrate depolymerase